MRIGYLINHYPKVSHSFIRREILALERLGHKVDRIALRGWDDELVDSEDRREQQLTRYVLIQGSLPLLLAAIKILIKRPLQFLAACLLTWRMGYRSRRSRLTHFAYLAEACRVTPWLQAAGVQHLHAHFGTNSADVAMMVKELGGPNWSFTAHGPEEFDAGPLIGLPEKIRRCAFVVAISSYGRSQLYRLVDHGSWSKVHVVHCGLADDYHAAPLGPEDDYPLRLVCVGRLSEQKGQLLLIEAARRLLSEGTHFELVLAGDGELRNEVEALITQYQLHSHVRVTGWISGEQVRAEILAARALVLPSFAEGLPVVIMEAMALKRPVISTFVAGIPELVRSPENGWLVPAGDVDALVDAMRKCLQASPELLSCMGDAAQKRVRLRHSIDASASKLIDLFSCCARGRASIDSQPHFFEQSM